MVKIQGQKITEIRTLKSMYDNNCVEITLDNKKEYLMSTKTILQMVNEFEFEVEKKRVHSYLVNAKRIEDKS